MIKKHDAIYVQGQNKINGNFRQIIKEKLCVDLVGPYNT